MRERSRQTARDVVGDMAAADGNGVGIDHVAIEEHGEEVVYRRPCRSR